MQSLSAGSPKTGNEHDSIGPWSNPATPLGLARKSHKPKRSRDFRAMEPLRKRLWRRIGFNLNERKRGVGLIPRGEISSYLVCPGIPNLSAILTSSARDLARIFCMMWLRWTLIGFSVLCSSSAICLLSIPSQNREGNQKIK